MLKLISLDEIEPGMILGSPIKNKYGQVLLAAKIALVYNHKNLLKTWGITTLYIVDPDQNTDEKSLANNRSIDAEKILRERLNWAPENVYEQDLYDMAIQSIIEKSNR